MDIYLPFISQKLYFYEYLHFFQMYEDLRLESEHIPVGREITGVVLQGIQYITLTFTADY